MAVAFSRFTLAALVIAAAGSIALAGPNEEGPRGGPDVGLPIPVSQTDNCTWTGTFALGPADIQDDEATYSLVEGTLTTLAWGMEIWGHAYLYNPLNDVGASATTLTEAAHSYGTVTVTRTVTGTHWDQTQQQYVDDTPHMRIDWFPRFRAEATVYDSDASTYAAGIMKGTCVALGVSVIATGGASADGEEHESGLQITLGGAQVTLSSANGDTNTDAPNDSGANEADIATAVAAFNCNSKLKVHSPANGWIDTTAECEAWIWESFPELDLHGDCKHCPAFAYVTYGWTQP